MEGPTETQGSEGSPDMSRHIGKHLCSTALAQGGHAPLSSSVGLNGSCPQTLEWTQVSEPFSRRAVRKLQCQFPQVGF